MVGTSFLVRNYCTYIYMCKRNLFMTYIIVPAALLNVNDNICLSTFFYCYSKQNGKELKNVFHKINKNNSI